VGDQCGNVAHRLQLRSGSSWLTNTSVNIPAIPAAVGSGEIRPEGAVHAIEEIL
jgi:hypothetical protein